MFFFFVILCERLILAQIALSHVRAVIQLIIAIKNLKSYSFRKLCTIIYFNEGRERVITL